MATVTAARAARCARATRPPPAARAGGIGARAASRRCATDDAGRRLQLAKGALDGRLEAFHVRHGCHIRSDTDEQRLAIAIQGHAGRAAQRDRRERIGGQDLGPGQIARDQDAGDVGDDEVEVAERALGEPRDDRARQHAERLGEDRRRVRRWVGLRRLDARPHLAEGLERIAERDRQPHHDAGGDVAGGGLLCPLLGLAQVDRHQGHQLGDGAQAMGAVPGPHGPRHDRADDVDHGAAERRLELAHLRERQRHAAQVARPAGRLLERRMAVEQHRLPERAQRGQRPADLAGMLDGVGQGAHRRAGAREVELDAVAQRLDQTGPDARWRRPGSLVVLVMRRTRSGHAGAIPIGHRGEDRVAADAVGHGVMELEEQGGAILRQAVVDARLPQRSGAIERGLVGGAELAQQLRPRAARHRVLAHVIVEVEGRIVLPVRQRQIEGRIAHALRQAGDGRDAALHGGAQPRRIGPAVEEHEHRHGGRLLRRVEPPERQILALQALSVMVHDADPSTSPSQAAGQRRWAAPAGA
ncbi:MAG TPA: hypothetical protein VL049_16560 [Candidatus Dormibacteraeota bacterium]|nr:hypothetical protein [Candidatus Dormibacteraeota bacterium]